MRLTINGRLLEVSSDLSVLDAVHQAGIRLPTLCHDSRLKASGNCRLCLVEIDGHEPAGTFLLHRSVRRYADPDSHTQIEAGRKAILGMLARAILTMPPAVAGQALSSMAPELRPCGFDGPTTIAVDDSHPYIRVDMSRCIYCDRCVRTCAEVQGQFVWSMRNRGEQTAIVPDFGFALDQSRCVSCGACVDACPTGALEDKHVIVVNR